ncbi:MAG: ribulose-phosphate 3-epimerase [Bacilli bacterium]
MKVAVSYINSKYDPLKTINLIDSSIADYIHVDLMDGLYVENKNFTISEINKLLGKVKKPLYIHLMVMNPDKYLNDLALLNTELICFHPSTSKDPIKLIDNIKNLGIKVGIVINPSENIDDFSKYFPLVDHVLLMSVTPGLGGQSFILNTVDKINEINKQNYSFELAVDGGINNETIKYLKDVDMVISGSFICMSDDFNKAIKELKKTDED